MVGKLSQFRVVGDEDECLVEVLCYGSQKSGYILACLCVKAPGGFVCQYDGRFRDEGAGDGGALLPAAGEHVGKSV